MEIGARRFPVNLAATCLVLTAFFLLKAVHAEVITVLTDENLPPFSFVREGRPAGVDVEMLYRAAEKVGVEVNVISLPWERVLRSIKNGDADWAMPLFRTEEREMFSTFVSPVHYSTTVIFSRRGDRSNYGLLEGLAGKHIGYNRGYELPPEIKAAVRQRMIFVEEVDSTAQNIQKVMTGRIDLFIANVANAKFVLRDFPYKEEIVPAGRPLSERLPAYLVVSRKSKAANVNALASSFRQALERMHNDGTYDEILEKFTRNSLPFIAGR